MTLTELWLIFTVRRRLFFTVLVSILLAVLVVSQLMRPTYLAEASLVIDTRGPDPITGNAAPEELTATIIATQTDIIESHNVALKVVDKLNLTKDPQYVKRFKDAVGSGPIRDWIADKLAEKVVVRPSRDSNVINIQYPAHDPDQSAALTNAFADAYIQASLELKADPARRQARWFDQETSELRRRVDVAQARLADEQRKTSIVGTSDHIDVDNAKLTEISTQLVAAQQNLYEARTRLRQMNDALAKNQLAALPDILGNPLLQTLKADLSRAEGTFADVSARFDRNHPQYLSAEATVKSLRSKLAAEVESVRGSIEQTAQINQHQVDALQRALDQQKAILLDEQHQHDSLDVLNREVESAQRAYDAGMQRATQVRLSSQLDQSSVAVLNPAVPPFEQARPKVLLYLLIAFVLGSMVAAGACVLAEIRDPRVRSHINIVSSTGLLVLAEIPKLPMPKRLRSA